MRCLAYILSLLVLLLALSHNAGESTTVQAHDVIIIDKVEYKVNRPLMSQIDSASYFSLKEKLDFNSSAFSWNFRGHVATFEVKGKKLFLNNIESAYTVHADFHGLLDQYMDSTIRLPLSYRVSLTASVPKRNYKRLLPIEPLARAC